MRSTLVNLFYWTLAFAPSVPYMLPYASYRRNLFHKRDALANLMSQKGVFDSYQSRFGRAGDQRQHIVQELFNLYYRTSAYWLAIGLNVVVITLGVAIGMTRVGVPIWFPGAMGTLAKSAPLTLCLGFAGAYVLSLYDTLRRCRSADLSAYSLHFTWVHMVLASILAPLVCEAFNQRLGRPRVRNGTLSYKGYRRFRAAIGKETARNQRHSRGSHWPLAKPGAGPKQRGY